MKYLMLIYGNEEIWNGQGPEELAKLIDEVDGFNEALRASGELLESEGLIPRARSVRSKGGDVVITDGPYIEAKEFVGSYFVVEVDGEERALEIARSYPGIRHGGGLEMWPLMGRGWASGAE
ncbi:YciI family protein [Thermopolyspora sp. NPDC052614]|uniref:YciI family protein n=1 Tax=Thermopolyspora sp. NPDC052614 TaxID=3155682 RepID=UPI003449C885